MPSDAYIHQTMYFAKLRKQRACGSFDTERKAVTTCAPASFSVAAVPARASIVAPTAQAAMQKPFDADEDTEGLAVDLEVLLALGSVSSGDPVPDVDIELLLNQADLNDEVSEEKDTSEEINVEKLATAMRALSSEALHVALNGSKEKLDDFIDRLQVAAIDYGKSTLKDEDNFSSVLSVFLELLNMESTGIYPAKHTYMKPKKGPAIVGPAGFFDDYESFETELTLAATHFVEAVSIKFPCQMQSSFVRIKTV